MQAWKKSTPGEDLNGVVDSMTFRREVNLGKFEDLRGKTVMVVGSGNAVVDPARTARRLGAAKVIVQFREVVDYRKYWGDNGKKSADWKVDEASKEGIIIELQKTPKRFIGDNGRLVKVESLMMEPNEPDSNGMQELKPVPGSAEIIPVDLVILAIGIRAGTAVFRPELKMNRDGTIPVDAETLATSMPSVFAGGDVSIGPSSITDAMGQGRRAAFYMDQYLQGKILADVAFDTRLPMVVKHSVVSRLESITERPSIVHPSAAPYRERIQPVISYDTRLQEIRKRFSLVEEREPIPAPAPPLETGYASELDVIFERYGRDEAGLIMILQEIQDQLNWLPPEALDRVAEQLNLPRARVQECGNLLSSLCSGTSRQKSDQSMSWARLVMCEEGRFWQLNWNVVLGLRRPMAVPRMECSVSRR